MKDEVINKMLEKFLGYVQNLETFSKAEVPKYISELLDYEFIRHIVEYFDDFLFTVPLCIVGIALSTLLYRSVKKDATQFGEELIPLVLMALALSIVPLGISIARTGHLLQAYKAKYAPRVYVIDYIRNAKGDK